MKEKIIVIIETSDVGAEYTAEAVKQLGFKPVFICNINNYQADTRRQIEKYTWYQADTKLFEDALSVIQNNLPLDNIEGVFTMLDSKLRLACEISDYLNVAGVDSAVHSLSSKGFVSALVPESSPPSIIFEKDKIPTEEFETILQTHGKIIVKPTCSAGAFGMFTMESQADIDEIDSLMKKENNHDIYNGQWIAQPFIDGKLFSLEGYALHGQVKFLGFTSREKIRNTESAYIFPDMSIPHTNKEECENVLKRLIETSGFKNGYFHSEFILHEKTNKCYLIDANVGRIAGAASCQQIALAYEKDPVEICKHIIDISLFGGQYHTDSKLYTANHELKQILGISYGVREATRLNKLILPEHFNFLHTQILDEDTQVPEMGVNNWSWIGLVVCYPHELDQVEKIILSTENGDQSPYYTDGDPIDFFLSCQPKPMIEGVLGLPLEGFEKSTMVTYPAGNLENRAVKVKTMITQPSGNPLFIFDRTPFHPINHAWPDQPSDRGWVMVKGGEEDSMSLPVIDCFLIAVHKENKWIKIASEVKEIKSKEKDDWLFLIAHQVNIGQDKNWLLPEIINTRVNLVVNSERRRLFSLSHTACHLAALALNLVLGLDLLELGIEEEGNSFWKKGRSRTDSIGNLDFDKTFMWASKITKEGSIDIYRLGKSSKKIFNSELLLRYLKLVCERINEQLQNWIAMNTAVQMFPKEAFYEEKRMWTCHLGMGQGEIPCGGTHVESLDVFSNIHTQLEKIESEKNEILLKMETRYSTV